MVLEITKKEFLLNVMTFKFAVGTILCVVLMAVFMPVLVNDYQQRLKDYNTNVSATQKQLQKAKVYETLLLGWNHFVYRPPTIFSTFSKDIAHQVGDSVAIGYFRIPELSAGIKEINPYISILPTLDISLIFKIIISVLALLVACDVISNEREQGTLKLMLSAGVARHQLLTGKLLAGLMTLFIPITMAFVIGLMIWQFSPMIDLTGADWARIAILYLASLLFISVMYHFGLFASCLTKRSSASLLLTLFFWMFFIVVLPNASLQFVTYLRPLGPEDTIDEQVKEIRERQQKESQELEKQVPWKGETIDIDEGMGLYYSICDQEAIEARQKRNAVLKPQSIRHVEERWKVQHTTTEHLFKQKRLSDAFSWASPISLYGSITSTLAGTDASNCEDFIKAAREYRLEVIDYIRSKTDNFSLPCFFTPFDAVDTQIIKKYNDPKTDAKDVEKWKELKQAQAKPINLEDFPPFAWKPDVRTAIARTIPSLSALFIINVLLFLFSFVAFQKYDVR
ncbi:MAG: ABC transporter permease subunit [Sedimentisphaerales bacterium]|nr:ABC transporter permease subunit [Sedimentisphaerales bacterium]